MGFGVQRVDSGVSALDFGFSVLGSRSRIQDLGFRVQGSWRGCIKERNSARARAAEREQERERERAREHLLLLLFLSLRDILLLLYGKCLRVWIWGLGFRVEDSESGVQGLGFKV